MVFKKYKKNTLKQSVIKCILNMLTTNDSYSLLENNFKILHIFKKNPIHVNIIRKFIR